MLIGTNLTSGAAVALFSTKAGAAFLTADGGSALIDGLPSRRARLRWMTAAGLVLGDYVTVTVSLATSSAINAVALLNTTLPIGLKVTVELWNGATMVNSTSVRTARLGDGAVGAVLRPARAPTVTQIRVLLYTDVNGVAQPAPGAVFDLGEIVAADLVDVPQQRDWSIELVDPSTASRTRGGRPVTVSKVPYRRFESPLEPQSKAVARAGGLSNGSDWEALRRAMLALASRTIAIPRHTTTAGSVDQTELEDTLLFGLGRMAPIVHLGGDFYGTSVTVEEVP